MKFPLGDPTWKTHSVLWIPQQTVFGVAWHFLSWKIAFTLSSDLSFLPRHWFTVFHNSLLPRFLPHKIREFALIILSHIKDSILLAASTSPRLMRVFFLRNKFYISCVIKGEFRFEILTCLVGKCWVRDVSWVTGVGCSPEDWFGKCGIIERERLQGCEQNVKEHLVVGCPSSHQLIRIREEMLESGNLFTVFSGSWISASVTVGNKFINSFNRYRWQLETICETDNAQATLAACGGPFKLIPRRSPRER